MFTFFFILYFFFLRCAAKNKLYLRKLGITHIVNTAEGKLFGMVDTDQDFYRNTSIQYLGFSLMDLPVTNISAHFEEVAEFIDTAVTSGGNLLLLFSLSNSWYI